MPIFRSNKRVQITIFTLAYYITALLLYTAANADNNNKHPYRITAGYWNDNFLLNDLYKSDSFHGADDYVTTSFWLQGMVQEKNTVWRIDMYHNALTNRAGNYRTDLVTLCFSGEQTTGIGPFQAGLGIVANGNFIGEAVQNEYHQLMGHDQVKLPYTVPEHIGPLVLIRYTPVILDFGSIRFSTPLSNTHRFVFGPSTFRSVIESTNTWQLAGSLQLNLSMHTGYTMFYQRDSYLKPMFDNGFTWGVMGTVGVVDEHIVSIWVTRNQYGRYQPHFGISYSYASGYDNLMIPRILDVLIP